LKVKNKELAVPLDHKAKNNQVLQYIQSTKDLLLKDLPIASTEANPGYKVKFVNRSKNKRKERINYMDGV